MADRGGACLTYALRTVNSFLFILSAALILAAAQSVNEIHVPLGM